MTSRHNFNVCGVIKFTVCFGFIYYHELDNCFGRAVFINLPRRGSSFPTFRVRSFCCVDRCLLNSFQFKCNKGGSCCTRSNKAPKAQQNRFSFIIVTFSIFLGAKRAQNKKLCQRLCDKFDCFSNGVRFFEPIRKQRDKH
jgi:hypothetical protein